MKLHRWYDDVLDSEQGYYRFFCECGVEIHPDCDMSSVSCNEALMLHALDADLEGAS